MDTVQLIDDEIELSLHSEEAPTLAASSGGRPELGAVRTYVSYRPTRRRRYALQQGPLAGKPARAERSHLRGGRRRSEANAQQFWQGRWIRASNDPNSNGWG